jgi:lysyl-tRNA synthetase class 2
MLAALRTPAWIGRLVWVVGLVTLTSALLPAVRSRTALVHDLVPAVFPAAATTGAAAVGVMLMVLAGGLRRGKRRAWWYATVLTALTVALHLLKGLDVEEAVLSAALLALLLASRARFTARPDPRSTRRVLLVVVLGPLVATLLGWAWLLVDTDSQAPGTTTWDRITQAFLGLVGIPGPVRFGDASDGSNASVALVVLGASVLVLAVAAALEPAVGPHSLGQSEEAALRTLLDRWGDVDSLSYFALRDDRSVIFSPTGKAAVTYRVVGTVSLAAGDPAGDPEAWPGAIAAWLTEARSFGWTPAVLAASERGTQAFVRQGMDALELGDEAIIHTPDFTLEGRRMRSVRQAVSRCDRAGLTVSCHRVGELDDELKATIRERADAWRDGEVERGFSMALGRLAAAQDPRAVVVLARDQQAELRGVLQLVPWGCRGLSLELMRRDRDCENGVVEQMVTGLMAEARTLGVDRVSLNFAVFRGVFARGERFGAGPVLRLWRDFLLFLSRFWQIESLYRANAKYQPEWVPRFVCFRFSSDLPRVSIAALRAEAFLVAPRWVQRLTS